MLSSVLLSKQPVQVNIEIMRAFVRLRGLLVANRELAKKLDELGREVLLRMTRPSPASSRPFASS